MGIEQGRFQARLAQLGHDLAPLAVKSVLIAVVLPRDVSRDPLATAVSQVAVAAVAGGVNLYIRADLQKRNSLETSTPLKAIATESALITVNALALYHLVNSQINDTQTLVAGVGLLMLNGAALLLARHRRANTS